MPLAFNGFEHHLGQLCVRSQLWMAHGCAGRLSNCPGYRKQRCSPHSLCVGKPRYMPCAGLSLSNLARAPMCRVVFTHMLPPMPYALLKPQNFNHVPVKPPDANQCHMSHSRAHFRTDAAINPPNIPYDNPSPAATPTLCCQVDPASLGMCL